MSTKTGMRSYDRIPVFENSFSFCEGLNLIDGYRSSDAVELYFLRGFRPYTRHLCPARGTRSLPGNVILRDDVSIAADERPFAVRAVRIFIFFHAPWQVPSI